MYALIIFDVTPKLSEDIMLPHFLENIQNICKDSSEPPEPFGFSVIVNLKVDLLTLCKFLGVADDHTISYKISYFETKPEFT
jgi:hypothetical protein